MSRQYGTVSTGIWDDEAFQELSEQAQRVYIMLTTQVGLTPAGTIPITLRRWAKYSKRSTIEGLSEALQELSVALFIVIDWDREELLVRSFVRWDHGYKNTKRLAAIRSAAVTIRSRLLAGVLAHELNRLEITHEIAAEPIDAALMGHRSETDPHWSVVTTEVSSCIHTPDPESTLREPQAADVPSDAGKPASRSDRGTRIPDDFAITDEMRAWARAETPGLDIDLVTKRFVLHFQGASGQVAKKVKWDAAWKKWMLGDYKPPGKQQSRIHPSRTIERDGKGGMAWEM